jgi:hypothetical protein
MKSLKGLLIKGGIAHSVGTEWLQYLIYTGTSYQTRLADTKLHTAFHTKTIQDANHKIPNPKFRQYGLNDNITTYQHSELFLHTNDRVCERQSMHRCIVVKRDDGIVNEMRTFTRQCDGIRRSTYNPFSLMNLHSNVLARTYNNDQFWFWEAIWHIRGNEHTIIARR